MAVTVHTTIQLEPLECVNCGATFGVTPLFDKSRRQDRRSFYCPNGHSQSYVTSEADRLRKELQRAQDHLARSEAQRAAAYGARDAVERRNAALRGVVTRTKKRISNGVCPCCTRTFVNLARHMTTKHPDYQTTEEETT